MNSTAIDVEFLQLFQRNRRLPDTIFYPLLVIYMLMITFGVAANGLVIVLVMRQRSRCILACSCALSIPIFSSSSNKSKARKETNKATSLAKSDPKPYLSPQ